MEEGMVIISPGEGLGCDAEVQVLGMLMLPRLTSARHSASLQPRRAARGLRGGPGATCKRSPPRRGRHLTQATPPERGTASKPRNPAVIFILLKLAF